MERRSHRDFRLFSDLPLQPQPLQLTLTVK